MGSLASGRAETLTQAAAQRDPLCFAVRTPNGGREFPGAVPPTSIHHSSKDKAWSVDARTSSTAREMRSTARWSCPSAAQSASQVS